MDARIQEVLVNGVTLSVTSAGDRGRPLVVLIHGFPDIGYSWRHQIPALVDAGYRVLAPDMRGYGWSLCPEDVEAYAVTELVADIVGLIEVEEATTATLIGHDWGSVTASQVALFHPEVVNGAALLSVPYVMRRDRSVIEHIRATDPEGPFGYMLMFQEPGVEDLLGADPIDTLRSLFWSVAGERPEGYSIGDPTPEGLPSYLSEGEMENYLRAFARSGFRGGLNCYRNMHRNWELTERFHDTPLAVPTLFIAGDRDFIVASGDGGLGSTVADMDGTTCVDHRGSFLIGGSGHWVHQERPNAVNERLVAFCAGVAEPQI